LRKRKPQETQALALASCQSWLPLLRPIIPIGWRLHPTQALAFLAVFVYGSQAIAFEWQPGLSVVKQNDDDDYYDNNGDNNY